MDTWKDLKSELRKLDIVPKSWSVHQFSLFLEIEALLHLVETLKADIDIRNVWMIVSGYVIQGVNETQEQQAMCLRIRSRLQYVKTANAWRVWLKWYREQPEAIRLYAISPEHRFQQKIHDAVLPGDRLQAYKTLFEDDEPVHDQVLPYAEANQEYTFYADGIMQSVCIPSGFMQFTEVETPQRLIRSRSQRDSVIVNLDALLETAEELDKLEGESQFEKPGNWHHRISNLAFVSRNADQGFTQTREITLDGLLHLAGALGVGKSTIIWVLTYHLARHGEKHITVVMNTVVEAIGFAVWLRKLGVNAAPALGRNRADHALKYELANENSLSVERIFHPDTPPEPVLEWMPTPCAISGMASTPVPVGEEPCRRLEDAQGKRHRCPLMAVCPVHHAARTLVNAQVWVLNPMSFLYSSAPPGIGDRRMMLFEAVYHLSDVVIIDEADRVQVQWDHAFAPTQPIAGSDDALLDALRRKLSAAATGNGRQKARTAAFNRLTNLDDQTNILVNRVYRLLGRFPHLLKWIKNWQMTNSSLFFRLMESLMKTLPGKISEADKLVLKDQLETVFKAYWEKPMRESGGHFALWVKDLLGSDVQERQLKKELEHWLTEQMNWKPSRALKYRRAVHRLDLAITLTAMMKQTNDIFHQLNWIEDEIGDLDNGSVELNDALVSLIPDPPMGDILGLRLINSESPQRPGVFTAIRHRGVGRWLMHNLDRVYADKNGVLGPHVLLTSATGWLPGSSQFHLAVQPDAVLTASETAEPGHKSTIHLEFRPHTYRDRWVKVSGAGKYKERNLQKIVQRLAKGSKTTPSDLQLELNFWLKRGEKRRVLLVVNSYEQSTYVLNELKRIPEWDDRVMCLVPDDTLESDAAMIRARQVEKLHQHDNTDVLIVPLMAIQRGFNILDEMDGALLGTAFFLVRPFPPPDDLRPQILSLNAWWMQQLDHFSRRLKEDMPLTEMRKAAFKAWIKRLKSNRGFNSIDDELYDEFLCDQFIPIWQTIGRLLRGSRDARVIFVDGAFGSPEGKRHMLHDWHTMLYQLIHTPHPDDQFLAHTLYGNAFRAFKEAAENRRIF